MGKDVQTSVAMLMVMSGLGDFYIKMMMLTMLSCSFVFRLYIKLIMLTFDHVVMGFKYAILTFAI